MGENGETVLTPEELAQQELLRVSTLVTVPIGENEAAYRDGLQQMIKQMNGEEAIKLAAEYKAIKQMYQDKEFSALIVAGLSPADMLLGAAYEARKNNPGKNMMTVSLRVSLVAGVRGSVARQSRMGASAPFAM